MCIFPSFLLFQLKENILKSNFNTFVRKFSDAFNVWI